MPKPMQSDQRYMPGLDGLRALAVLAVIAFHEQFGWAPGGLLGVGVFFTLSGYLITDLLLSQFRVTLPLRRLLAQGHKTSILCALHRLPGIGNPHLLIGLLARQNVGCVPQILHCLSVDLGGILFSTRLLRDADRIVCLV